MKYKVALYHSDEGVSASVPALPGCWSEGDTEAEALANIRDAIQEYRATLKLTPSLAPPANITARLPASLPPRF